MFYLLQKIYFNNKKIANIIIQVMYLRIPIKFLLFL